MSDFINGLGSRGPSAYGVGAPRPTGAAAKGEATAPGGDANPASAASAGEAFSPTSEAGESKQDTQAGEARASVIFAAWGSAPSAAGVGAGQLQIQGAENTSVNQVHGVQNGQHVGSQGPDAGFSGGTVFSSRRPPT